MDLEAAPACAGDDIEVDLTAGVQPPAGPSEDAGAAEAAPQLGRPRAAAKKAAAKPPAVRRVDGCLQRLDCIPKVLTTGIKCCCLSDCVAEDSSVG